MKAKRDERHRIWKSVLEDLVHRNPPKFTAEDLVDEEELTPPSASQLLARLRQWGYIRLTGFAPASGGVGRQKHVYEVTEKAKKKFGG
jgi:predicted ArsR family transcriptional regulator